MLSWVSIAAPVDGPRGSDGVPGGSDVRGSRGAAPLVGRFGPVGVGKTFLATALGHIAIRRGHSAHFDRADVHLKRLKASRLDNSHGTEVRKLLRVDVLILDDFALRSMDQADTAEVYELIVERHRRASTILTSNRDTGEMLAQMADPLLAQYAIDRLHSNAHELVVIDGGSYRRWQRPALDANTAHSAPSPRRT